MSATGRITDDLARRIARLEQAVRALKAGRPPARRKAKREPLGGRPSAAAAWRALLGLPPMEDQQHG
jgi:hypothetical protein